MGNGIYNQKEPEKESEGKFSEFMKNVTLLDRSGKPGLFTTLGVALEGFGQAQRGKEITAFDNFMKRYSGNVKESIDQNALIAGAFLPEDERADYYRSLITSASGNLPTVGPNGIVEPDPKALKGFRETAESAGKRSGQMKVSEQTLVEESSAQKQLGPTARFFKLGADSLAELEKDFPNIGDPTTEGFLERRWAQVMEKTGKYPNTKAFERRKKVSANKAARDVEGGRVTDQDRQVYADAMMNFFTAPSETNAILMSESLLDLHDKGGDVSNQVNEMINSGIPLLKNAGEKVAEAINLPITNDVSNQIKFLDEQIAELDKQIGEL